MVRVSKFYKESKEGKYVTHLTEDTRTLYDTFRKGAKVSSKFPPLIVEFLNQNWVLQIMDLVWDGGIRTQSHINGCITTKHC